MKLPLPFEIQMRRLIGEDDFDKLCDALERDPQIAFRPNESKGFVASDATEQVPWSSKGHYLAERPPFTFDPLFHAGAYYVQEPSSMFIERAMALCGSPRLVLDLCAAPGGKSTLIRSLLPDDSLLVVNEPNKLRAQVLLENMTKWGHPNVVVTNGYPKDFARSGVMFDVIAIDAPCSGEGMFRKDNPALDEWSIENVEMCAARQFQIVEDVWPALSDGGYLIYSTCTYNTVENEQNVARFCQELGAEPVAIDIQPEWNIEGSLLDDSSIPVYHFIPHKTRGEGFFLCLLRKVGGSESRARNKARKNSFTSLPAQARDWLSSDVSWSSLQREDTLYALPSMWTDVAQSLLQSIAVLSPGVAIANVVGRKMKPHHALALTNAVQSGAFPRFELSKADALTYLRRQSLVLSADTPRGFVIVTYQGVPLGFVNNLGAHANNVYPPNWKIRSSHDKDDAFDFVLQQSK